MRTEGRALRVLHASEVHWGGVVTLLDQFVGQQVRAGHDVRVLAPEGMPPLGPGVTMLPWEIDRSRPASLARATRTLRRVVQETRPDVVHLHSWFAGAVGRLPLTGRSPAPIVYQPHAWSDRLLPHRMAGATLRASERVFARRTTVLVANCQDELDRGRAFGVDVPGHAIGVTVDLNRFRPPTAAERAQARAELGIPQDRRLVLVLGRLARQKGQDLLVPAWCAAPPTDATLALVGPGDTAPLAALAGRELDRSVIMPGGADDVLPWLWAADLMALPSRYETVALVVAEAMATGLPVVATSVDGTAEVLRGGPGDPAGAVVPVGDTTGMMRELSRRLDDHGLRAREGTAGPILAKERFAPEAVAARLEAAYRDAIRLHEGGTR